MIKFIGLGKRHESWTRDQFTRYWFEKHGPLCVSVEGFIRHARKYVQYHPLRESLDDGWDAVGELSFDTFDEMRAAFSSPEYLQNIRPDEIFIARLDAGGALATAEAVIWRAVGELGPVQVFSFLKRVKGLTQEEFNRYWQNEHGPSVARMPGLRKDISEYVQNRVVSPVAEDPMNTGHESRFDFDGAITARVNSAAAVDNIMRDPAARSVFEGNAHFADLTKGLIILRVPRVMYDTTAPQR